jgi:sugar lactone lactonase YvrE
VKPEATPRVAVPSEDALGESVFWHAGEQALYWIDFFGPTLHRWDPASGARQKWAIPGSKQVGSAVPLADGRLLLALDDGLHIFDPARTRISFFADPNGGRPGIGYNDAKIDRAGRYWVGTYDAAEREPRGILYRVDPDGSAHVADSGHMVCNGPAFSPDGHALYFSDTARRRLFAYDLDPATGALGTARPFARIAEDEGLPYGLTVDADGFVWCAHYGGGRVTRFAPDGRSDRTIALPVPFVTSCCFGGASLETLYITTARSGMDAAALAAAPASGALFAVEPGVAGIADRPFVLAGR